MINDESLLKDLENFVREEIGEFKIEMFKNTLIEDDLGVTGNEAIDLIKKFSARFNVDISHFKPDQYFYPEPGIFSKFENVKPLKLGDLENAISYGKLNDKIISS